MDDLKTSIEDLICIIYLIEREIKGEKNFFKGRTKKKRIL